MNKRIIATGNPEFGVASAIFKRWPDAEIVGQTTRGLDLTIQDHRDRLAKEAL